jgi:hypothetical protein
MAVEEKAFDRSGIKLAIRLGTYCATFCVGVLALNALGDHWPNAWAWGVLPLPVLIVLAQASLLYFDRDQQRDGSRDTADATITFRITKLELCWRLLFLAGLAACLYLMAMMPRDEKTPYYFSVAFFYSSIFFIAACCLLFLNGMYYCRRDRYLALGPAGFAFPLRHPETIPWSDIEDVVVEPGNTITCLRIKFRSPASRRIQHFWDQFTLGRPAWSEDGRSLRIVVTGFGAGAGEIYRAIKARLA